MQFSLVTFVVPDYDQAIAFFCDVLGFHLLEDTDLGNGKRWVRVAPDNRGSALLLAKAVNDKQRAAIGNQTGGRVAFFLETENFSVDYAVLKNKGLRFCESPRHESYGTVAVFEDPWGNAWDLIEPKRD
jgi:catechol 2,3-dioxygenase-like lactoylglutathione lyase family enzyme